MLAAGFVVLFSGACQGAPYKVPGYPVVVFGAHFSSSLASAPSSALVPPLDLVLVSFNVSFICIFVLRHEKDQGNRGAKRRGGGLKLQGLPGLPGIALYWVAVFTI